MNDANKRILKIIFIIVIGFAALIIRFIYKDFESADYQWFLKVWFEQLQDGGGFLALKQPISNYSPLYIYLLAGLTYLPIKSLYSIKILSIVFDFIAAYYVFKLMEVKYKDSFISYIASGVVLLLPTVIINGAYAAQCDIIFSTFLLGTIYYFVKEKNILALIFFGIAVSFKLQGAFLAPLLLILIIRKQIKIWHLFISPLTYIASLLPAFFIGRPFKELITIYFSQVGYYPYLTMNCANIYQFFPNANFELFNKLGFIFTFIVVLAISIYIGISKKKLNGDLIIEICILILLVIPYFLPQMHERYYFPAEILVVIYAFYNWKYFYISLSLILVSLLSYGPFLLGKHIMDMKYLAVMIFLIILFFIIDIHSKLKYDENIILD